MPRAAHTAGPGLISSPDEQLGNGTNWMIWGCKNPVSLGGLDPLPFPCCTVVTCGHARAVYPWERGVSSRLLLLAMDLTRYFGFLIKRVSRLWMHHEVVDSHLGAADKWAVW